jgi:hypothetical protein
MTRVENISILFYHFLNGRQKLEKFATVKQHAQ